MAITPFKTFAAAEILTAADLNSSFSKITNNGEDLAWPATKAKDLDGQVLILDADGDTSITSDTDDRIDFACNSFDVVRMNTVTSAVNGLDSTASATGTAVLLAPYGSDSNIDLNIAPKGTGNFLVKGVNTFRGHLDGLITSNGTDADHDIDTSVGTFMDSTHKYLFELTSIIVKQIDANWAEGTANGGFPSGLTLSVDTDYHYFLIGKTDGTVDAGWDTSLSATNLLSDASGYTLFRRIARHRTDSASNILPYFQKNDYFYLGTPINDVADVNPGTSAQEVTVSTPLGIVTRAIIIFSASDDSPAITVQYWLGSLNNVDFAPDITANGVDFITGVGTARGSIVKQVLTNTSSQVRYRQNGSDVGITTRLTTMGWVDCRGKDQ